MVDDMKIRFQSAVLSLRFTAFSPLISVSCLLFSVCGFAEELTDPTKPPVSISAPLETAAVVKKEAVLQSILISEKRRAAIIDGVTVELGATLEDARLIEVNTNYVVLKTGKQRQVLKLFPEVTMTRIQAQTRPVMSGEKK